MTSFANREPSAAIPGPKDLESWTGEDHAMCAIDDDGEGIAESTPVRV